MGTPDSAFRTLADLQRWLERAPEGTRLEARELADVIRNLPPEVSVETPSPEAPDPPAIGWRERLWTVPSETRLGVVEVAEALGRPKSYVYAHTGSAAEDPLPHRKLDGVLLFTAGELRAWIRDHEETVHGGPMEPPSRSLEVVR